MVVIIFSTLIIIVLSLTFYFYRKGSAKLQSLWDDYVEALSGGDKKRALDAGRLYYKHLRGGRLTIYDEQAITNDLSTMK